MIKKVRVLQNKLHIAAKKERSRTFGILYDKICWHEVLWVSWKRVLKNKGAPGVDGRTIRAIKEYGEDKFLREIQLELLEKNYKPTPIKRVYIKKSNGKLRPLGIPTVKDRVIQGAVKLVIEPIFESNFLDESYGFRPRRSCQDALVSIRKWVTYGYSTVIDADISEYFDNIDHDLLMRLIRRRIRDKHVLRLIKGWLKSNIFEQDKQLVAKKGTPQGGVISPLLANVYLHTLDKYWQETHNHWKTKLIRYCDDFVILIRNDDPNRYMKSLENMLSKLKLELSSDKTIVTKAEKGFDFLGVTFRLKDTKTKNTGKFCYGYPSRNSMQSIRKAIREEVGKNYQPSLAHQIKYLEPLLRGWANYFNWLNSGTHFKKLDRYVAQKLNRWNRIKHNAKNRKYKYFSSEELWSKGLYRTGGKITYV